MKRLHKLLGWIALVLAVALPTAASAQQPRRGPRQWIQLRHGVVTRLLQAPEGSPEAAQRDERIARLIDEMLDIEQLARAALGPYWEQRSEAERREFTDLLRQLIQRNYRDNLRGTLNFEVQYGAEQVTPQGARVPTVARSRADRRAAPVSIEYRLQPRGSDWVVEDLVTNGSSLVQTYRESYTRIVRDRGFPELLNRMRARLRAGSSQGGATLGTRP